MFGKSKKNNSLTTLTTDPITGEVVKIEVEERHPLARVFHPRRQKKSRVAEVAPALAVLLALGGKPKDPKSTKADETTAPKEAVNIASQSGMAVAPARILLAIAHGLATGDHWWLQSPSTRESEGCREIPTPANLGDVLAAHEVVRKTEEMYGSPYPYVRFSGGSTFEWAPLNGENLDSDHGRKVMIEVEEGATTGTIQWHTGKSTEQGDEWTCSSFIASLLVLLPDAVDDGTLSRMFHEEDVREARRVATIMAAKQAGATGDILVNGRRIASAMQMAREQEYHLHLGYQPRRAWNMEGREFRLARWIRQGEFKELVAKAKPYEWVESTKATK